MTTSRTRTPALSRRLVAAALTTVLGAATLSSCGGEDKSEADQPVETSSSPTLSSSSVTPTPTPTPTPTLRPLSRFEDEPTVKVARKWAIAAARSSTADDRSMRLIKPFVTPTGLKKMQGYFAEDMGNAFPGPVPFTPVSVKEQVGSAKIAMCMWTGGFNLDPKTMQPTEARRIDAGTFLMVKQAGVWKINDMVYAQHSCKKTVVKGRAF